MEKWDVIIVGGAAAGLTAGMYAARRKLKTLIITKDTGGQTATTTYLENYPGFLKISGPKLMSKFEKNARKSGAEIIFDEVNGIKEVGKEFIVSTSTNQYKCKAVILSFGKTPRNLEVPGEDKLKGRGVSYCTTCDAPLFGNKDVVVVGGGNSALDAALLLSKIGKKVYLIHRRDQFRGFEYMVERVKSKRNVEFVMNSVVKEIKGKNTVEGVVVQNVVNNETREIPVQGVFVEIGSVVKTDFLKGLVELDQKGQVKVNALCETSHPGIFAAGDVTSIPFKQTIVSASDGCKAALQAYNYINVIPPDRVVADWK